MTPVRACEKAVVSLDLSGGFVKDSIGSLICEGTAQLSSPRETVAHPIYGSLMAFGG